MHHKSPDNPAEFLHVDQGDEAAWPASSQNNDIAAWPTSSQNNDTAARPADDVRYPHAPDVLERDTADLGFSRGWGMHFQPSTACWYDAHVHFSLKRQTSPRQIEVYRSSMSAYPVTRAAVILSMSRSRKAGINLPVVPDGDLQLAWYLYMDYRHPDLERLREGIRAGIRGIKLHNAMIITDGADPHCWLSDQWRQVFELLEQHRLPVLWHVTQRLTDSPYTGGKRNLYWETGWEKGVSYTNQDLLDIFIEVVRKYPGIPFIAAHQLHLSWSRLAMLFDSCANLYTDTSVGCFVREFDTLYDTDRDWIRSFFIKYCQRILFGTDFIMPATPSEASIRRIYDGHIRFIRQLRLPDDVMQMISHQNAERIL